MSDDLVKRLRDGGFLMVDDRSSIREYYVESEKLKGEAADHIEKLKAALRNTAQFMEHYSYVWNGTNGTHPAILIDEARKALEGKDD